MQIHMYQLNLRYKTIFYALLELETNPGNDQRLVLIDHKRQKMIQKNIEIQHMDSNMINAQRTMIQKNNRLL